MTDTVPAKGLLTVWWRWIAVVILSVVLACVVLPVGVQMRRTALYDVCRGRLKQLGLALHSYHDQYQCLPPAYVLGPDGKKWHSWRVLVLPFLGEETLYSEYRLDEPWNGPNNSQLMNRMPDVFGSPLGDRTGPGTAHFLAIVGRKSAWPEYLSLSFSEFTDGKSNVLLLVESADSDIAWLEPRDLSVKQMLKLSHAESGPRCVARIPGNPFLGLLADGAVKSLSNSLAPDVLGGLVTPAMGGSSLGKTLPIDADDRASETVFPTEKDANLLTQTDVQPYSSMPIKAGRNYLYCCTFQMAWDTLRRPPDNLVHTSPVPLMAAELNRSPFSPSNLDPRSFHVQVEPITDVAKIHAEMARRFPSAAGPRTPPTLGNGFPGLVVFSYLRKGLPYRAKFDSLDTPFSFPSGEEWAPVVSFGRKGAADSDEDERLKQVRIHDYRTDDDFILELVSESQRDQLLLAKIPAEPTLQETIDAVMSRIRQPNPKHQRPELGFLEDLIIPKLSLNVLKDYDELKRLNLPDLVAQSGGRAWIESAQQGIAFVLDEHGAQVESFAEMALLGEFGESPDPPAIRKFVFDRPFLVLLRERQADSPYLALWIENAELMLPLR